MTALVRALWLAAIGPLVLLVPSLRRRFFSVPKIAEAAK